MNGVRYLAARALLTLAAWLLLTECRSLAQESGLSAAPSIDPAEKVPCKRQLNRITGAIREYRKDHEGRLPDRLADLTPDYIHDPRVLVCPYVRSRGGLRTWKRQTAELSVDAYSSYHYEFAQDPVDAYRWRGLPKKTWQEAKARLENMWGDVVPIVRCHDHDPRLNLAVGGPIYESGRNWEENFGKRAEFSMTFANLFPSPEATEGLGPKDFPPRDPCAPPQLLDLTAYYNAALTNSWQGFGGNDLASLPTGIRKFDGVQFDVRGVIQLRGTQLPAMYPWRVDDIPVRQKCARIFSTPRVGFILPAPLRRATRYITRTARFRRFPSFTACTLPTGGRGLSNRTL